MSELPPGYMIVQPPQPAPGAQVAPLPTGFTIQQPPAPRTAVQPIQQEAPNLLERFGHGMDRTKGGIYQAFLELKAKMAPQTLSSQITGKTQAQQDLDDYTDQLKEDERLYQKGRGKDAGIDWASGAGSLAASAPLVMLPGAGEGVIGRALIGAAGGGLDAASQPTETGNMLDRAKAGAVGAGVGAVAAPAIGAVGDKLVKALSSVPGRVAGLAANLTGKNTAQRIVADIPELQSLPATSRNDLVAEAQAQISKTGNLDAAALGRKANLLSNGLTPTTSMVTRDPAQWTMERNLQKLAQSPDEQISNTGQELTRVYQGNDQALTNRMTSLAKPYGAATQEGRGMTVMQSLDDLAKSSQKDVSAVYDSVRAQRGEELASDARNLHSTLDDLSDSPAADPVTEAAKRRLKKLGMVDADGNLTDKSLTVTQAEGLRQFINQQPNVYGKSQIIKAIDQDVIGGLGEDAFKGARAGAKQRFDMLNNPATQKALNNIGELTQGRAAQSLIKSQIISAPEQDVASLLDTIGMIPTADQRSAALGAIRGGVMNHLEDEAVKNNGQFSGAALKKAMEDIGPNKLRMVLGDDAHGQLDSLAKAGVDATYEPPYGAVGHSNTAATLLSLMKGARVVTPFGGHFPLINDVAIKKVEESSARSDAAAKLAQVLSAQSTPKSGLSAELQKRLNRFLVSGGAPLAQTGVNQLLQPSGQ